jgi:hypothetical protein
MIYIKSNYIKEKEVYNLIISGYDTKTTIETIIEKIMKILNFKIKQNKIEEKMNTIENYFKNKKIKKKKENKINIVEDIFSSILSDEEEEENENIRKLFICVHNLDDLISRDSNFNNLFSKIINFKNIHLFCSVDHINSQFCIFLFFLL